MNKFSVSASEGLYNCRIKFYPSESGDLYVAEKMVSRRKIFNPSGLEYDNDTVPFTSDPIEVNSEIPEEFQKLPFDNSSENLLRSFRRAKSKLYDLIRCNPDMVYFCTLTFDGELVERCNYDEVMKKFNNWCGNRVRRDNLKYVSVIERHKKSEGLHFHLLANDVISLADSGTVKVPGKKKPIKVTTADRYKVPIADRKIVYNIADWSFGFSTAIQITGDPQRIKVASYLQKYLVKVGDKVGGRWYYSGGALARPVFKYCNDDYFCTDFDFEIHVPCNDFKVMRNFSTEENREEQPPLFVTHSI